MLIFLLKTPPSLYPQNQSNNARSLVSYRMRCTHEMTREHPTPARIELSGKKNTEGNKKILRAEKKFQKNVRFGHLG